MSFVRNRSQFSVRRGFSLVELALSMAIIATLAGIAIPRYAQAVASYRASAAAQRMVSDFNLAQTNARVGSSSQTMTFSTTTNSYVITGVRDLDTAANTYTVRLDAEPYRATISRITLATGASQITFNGYGVPNTGGTVQVQAGTTSRTVTIDAASGRATWR